jgi:hypothetical protein
VPLGLAPRWDCRSRGTVGPLIRPCVARRLAEDRCGLAVWRFAAMATSVRALRSPTEPPCELLGSLKKELAVQAPTTLSSFWITA